MPKTATVLSYSRAKGWGWAVPDDCSNDVFVHRAHLQPDRKYLNEGDIISFESGEFGGKPCAINIRFLRAEEPKSAGGAR